jgi:hypothetical protein
MSDEPPKTFGRKIVVYFLKLLFFVDMVLIVYLIATSNWREEVFYTSHNGKEALYLTLGALLLLHFIRMFD